MSNASWHNFNVILLNCGMNIQMWKIQDKSSYWHKNDNTSSILTKQLCLLKITWPKKVIPTKSYSLAMLYLHHTKYLIMHNHDDKPSNCFILLMFSKLFQSSRNCSDQTSNSLIFVLRCHPWISNADTTQYFKGFIAELQSHTY